MHLNRLINKYDLNAIFLAGPGHGAPGVLAPVYLEGAYAEIYRKWFGDKATQRALPLPRQLALKQQLDPKEYI